jgi:zinc protease
MQPITKLCALVLFGLLALPIRGAAAPTPAPRVDVTRATFDNGLQVVVLRNTLAPAVSIWTNYLAGANDESIVGIAHAQEHMMFRGSRTIDASQFSQSMAVTGGSFNADTQSEITQYFFEVPSQYLDIALNLERSRAEGILDTQSLWDQERGAITQEVTRDNSSASYRLYEKTLAHMFAGTPYADAGLGTVASFKRIQAPDLKAFYNAWYHPNNAIMVIAGNVDPRTTIAKVRALFGNIPAAKLPAHKPVHLQTPTPLTLRDNSSDPITLAFIAYRVPGYSSPDYFASEILNDVLNSQRGALYELQASGKALGTFAQSVTHPEAGLSLVGSAVAVTTSGDQAVTDLQSVIDGYKQSGLPPDLVEVAKARELAQAQRDRNSISGLASEWSQTLAIEHRTPDEDLAGLERVTVADVNRVLRTYYDRTQATVAIATPKEATGSAFGGREGENNAIPPSKHGPLPAFARNVLANLRVPEETVHPSQETLPNGLKLVVVPTKITPTVVLRGQVLANAGIQAPAGKEGVDQVLEGLYSYGTTTYDRIAYQTELDKIAADVDAGATFSLDVLAKDFDRGVELLADDELHPALPPDAFAIVQKQTVGQLTGELKSPDNQARRAIAAALYPSGDPARRFATPQTVGALTLDDVKNYAAAVMRPDLATIVIVGDVTVDQARSVVEKWFGSWKADGPTPNVFPPAVAPNRASRRVIPATGRVQSEVTLSESLPITYTNPDYPVLRLANTVLSGGFYDSILYRDVRELHGYAYSVDSSVTGGHNRSTFRVNFGADPQNVAAAQRIIVDDIAAMARTPLEPDRLLRAKALALGALPVRQASYDGLASQLLTYAATGRPLNQDRIDAAAQLRATPQSVRSAMARWIRPKDFAEVVVGPAR